MKNRWQNLHIWGMIIIPIVILFFVVLGCFTDITKSGLEISILLPHFYDWNVSKTLFMLEILPFIVCTFSIHSLLRHRRKIRFYRIAHPIAYSRGIWNKLIAFVENTLALPKRFFIPQLAYFMLLFWSIGWGLYIYALWTNYESNRNVAELLGYSAMASLDLFLMDINGNILDAIGDTMTDVNASLLKGCITIIAICSAFCSVFLIVKLFLFKLLSLYHTSHIKIKPTERNHLYIFWDINEKSLQLAKSIRANDPDRSLMIFIDYSTDSEDGIDATNTLVNHLTVSSSKLSSVNLDDHTIILSTTMRLEDVSSTNSIWSDLGIEELECIFLQLDGNIPQYSKQEQEDEKREAERGKADWEKKYWNQIHIFFMSENRDRNVLCTKIISDIFKHEDYNYSKEISKIIYCNTRQDNVTGIVEDSCSSRVNKLEIKIIDDAHLSIDLLKRDVYSHPINFVDIDKTNNYGSVKSQFTSLIVGFGETGRDALRYIYEFSAFIDSKSTIPQRSPFRAYIVDENMQNLKGHFIENNPHINSELNIAGNNYNNLVEFCDYNDKSHEFYRLLKDIAPSLNYVVVAIGDDEANITLAINILKLVRRYRKDLTQFRIFVRTYNNSSFSHLDGIARRYNETLKTESNNAIVIQIFGSKHDIYSYSTIIKDEFLNDAKDYYNSYSEEYNKTVVGQYDEYKETGWEYRRDKALLSKNQSLIDDLRRKEFQDRENALHKLTKLHILESVLLSKIKYQEEEQVKLLYSFIEAFFKLDLRTNKYRVEHTIDVTYPGVSGSYDFATTLITNLAITEHLRWNASHEMMGYTFIKGCKKSTIKMTHKCLVPWDQLPEIVIATGGTERENADNSKLERLYDYLVVETSLLQKKKELDKILHNNP